MWSDIQYTGISLPSGLAPAELIAILTAVTDDQPRVMTLRGGEALPSGPFESSHRSLQSGLRAWIEAQTGHPVGYLEQLYTFADKDRDPRSEEVTSSQRISISYLGLVREQDAAGARRPTWRSWYRYFPWEDHRGDHSPKELPLITDRLTAWAAADALKVQRVDYLFGLNGKPWNEELVLQRYELMYEAGLVDTPEFGVPMAGDNRRILATGISRLRAKIKYSPVVFELLPESFTLLQLQRTVEALSGLHLHKPNFRRQIDQQELVEETGEMSSGTSGRPARLFRYRPAILEARMLSGARLPLSRP